MTGTSAAQVFPAADPGTGAGAFVSLVRRLAFACDVRTASQALVDAAVVAVPGARWASVCRAVGGRITTCAASDPVARDMDRLQYRLGAGPLVATLRDECIVCVSPDLATDTRWPELSERIVGGHGVSSALAARLVVDAAERFDASLTVYGDRVGAFAATTARSRVELLVAVADLAVAAAVNREQARSLVHALSSNRDIGVAIGVLMTTHRLTREQAFDLLRVASQNTNRKLHDIAADVADTGMLELPVARTGGTQARR